MADCYVKHLAFADILTILEVVHKQVRPMALGQWRPLTEWMTMPGV